MKPESLDKTAQDPLKQQEAFFRFMLECCERLHIYKESCRSLVELCSPDTLALSQSSSSYLSAEQWSCKVYDCIEEWSTWDLVSTLAKWTHINSTLEQLYHMCPPDIKREEHLGYDNSSTLNRFKPPISETMDAIHVVLSTEGNVQALISLKTADALSLIELLDQVMGFMDPHSRLYTTAFHTFRKLCAQNVYVPESFTISGTLRTTHEQPEAFGSFADVWHARYGDRDVALKSIRISGGSDLHYIMETFCKEAVLWRHLTHPNITLFLGIDTTVFRLCMVSEWMPNGNIRVFLKDHPDTNRRRLVADIAQGLGYLHSFGVVHGDLKGANILVNDRHYACISDFGLTAVIYGIDSVNLATAGSIASGSVRWMAPENLDPEIVGDEVSSALPESDVHAFAMVIWEVFTGRNPYDEFRLEAAVMHQILRGVRPKVPFGGPTNGLSGDMRNIMEMCWHPDWAKRPRMSAVVALLGEPPRSPTLGEISRPPNYDQSVIGGVSTAYEGPKRLERGLVSTAYSRTVPSVTDLFHSSDSIAIRGRRDASDRRRTSRRVGHASLPRIPPIKDPPPAATLLVPGFSRLGILPEPQADLNTSLVNVTSTQSIPDSPMIHVSRDDTLKSFTNAGRSDSLSPSPREDARLYPKGYIQASTQESHRLHLPLQRRRVPSSSPSPPSSDSETDDTPIHSADDDSSFRALRTTPKQETWNSEDFDSGFSHPIKSNSVDVTAFRKVYLTKLASGTVAIVKQAEKVRSDDAGAVYAIHSLLAEKDILTGFEHPNVITLLGFEETPAVMKIFLESPSAGSIGSALRHHGRLDEDITKSFTQQTLAAIEYIHQRGIVHGNVRADNILVENNGVCKISNFGTSRRIEDDGTHTPMQIPGTKFWVPGVYTLLPLDDSAFWMSPEMVNIQTEILYSWNTRKGQHSKMDIWGVGCLVYEMWTGHRPWIGHDSLSVLQRLHQIKEGPPLPEDIKISLLADDFQRRCFIMDPDERPTAASLREHSYLALASARISRGFV